MTKPLVLGIEKRPDEDHGQRIHEDVVHVEGGLMSSGAVRCSCRDVITGQTVDLILRAYEYTRQ